MIGTKCVGARIVVALVSVVNCEPVTDSAPHTPNAGKG
jgi:hypothetical protein